MAATGLATVGPPSRRRLAKVGIWLRLLMVPFVLPASLAWLAARRETTATEGRRPGRGTA